MERLPLFYFLLPSLWSQTIILSFSSFLHAHPKSKGAAHFLQERGSRASWMKFALLLGQLASFMFPTECPSVLSKAWFCELTSDRHFLRLTCQLHGGLPHLQHGACKHRPSPPSQEESYGVLLVSALFLFFLLARHILLCLGSVSMRVSVYRRGHMEEPALSTLFTLERERARLWVLVSEKRLAGCGGDFLQGYKPALLIASSPVYMEKRSVVSCDWVNAWKSAFVAHVFQKFQNITVSRLYQDHTWVYLPSFQDFPWKEITKSVEAFKLVFFLPEPNETQKFQMFQVLF